MLTFASDLVPVMEFFWLLILSLSLFCYLCIYRKNKLAKKKHFLDLFNIQKCTVEPLPFVKACLILFVCIFCTSFDFLSCFSNVNYGAGWILCTLPMSLFMLLHPMFYFKGSLLVCLVRLCTSCSCSPLSFDGSLQSPPDLTNLFGLFGPCLSPSPIGSRWNS